MTELHIVYIYIVTHTAIYGGNVSSSRTHFLPKHCLKQTTGSCSQCLTFWNMGSNLVKTSKFRVAVHFALAKEFAAISLWALYMLLSHTSVTEEVYLHLAKQTSLHKDKPRPWQACKQQIMSGRSRNSLCITKMDVTPNHQPSPWWL